MEQNIAPRKVTSLLYFFRLGTAVAGVPQINVMGILEAKRSLYVGTMAHSADFIWEVDAQGNVSWFKNRFHRIPEPRTVDLFLAAIDEFTSAAARVPRALTVHGSSVEPTVGALGSVEAPAGFLAEGR